MTAAPLSPGERATLTRIGYLVVVIVGFLAAVALDAGRLSDGSWPAIITGAFTIGIAVRYWWVILLLAWPFTVARAALLLAMWAAVDILAVNTSDVRAWGWSLAAVFLIGTATELYNHATRQWAVAMPEFERSLRDDHVRGAASAAIATVATVTMVVTFPRYMPAFVAALVIVDWIRLVEMVRRHRRFLETAA